LPLNAEDAEENGEVAETDDKEPQLRAERDSLPRSERGFEGVRRSTPLAK